MIADLIRGAWLAVIAAHLVIGPASAEDERLRVIKTQSFKPMNEALRIDHGRVVFSKYNEDGNTQDVIAIDPADGGTQTLVTGVRDARFVAANDRYLAYGSNEHRLVGSLIVADRETGQRLASVRLRDRIIWGHIVGERLIVIQAATGGYGRLSTSPALIYRLPALQLERTTTVTGAHEVQLWNDKIVLLGQQLAVFDIDLNRLAVADFPTPDPRYPSRCSAHTLRVQGDQAILAPNCGQIAIYDLPDMQLARVIPGFATFHTFDMIDGLLFVTGEDQGIRYDGRAIEVSTGREVARLKLEAQFLAAQAGHLLGITRGFATPAHATVYEPDLKAIRSDTSRAARVLAACAQANSTGDGARDIYRAIDDCEAAGIQSYLDVASFPAELTTAIGNYAEWLAHSLSRFGEAIPILERLGRNSRRDTLLALAQRKAQYFGTSAGPAQVTSSAQIPGVRKQALDFGAFSHLIAFEGNRGYVARYDCVRSGTSGVTLDVVDRESFSLIKRVAVAGCDDDYQDNISFIHLLSGYLVLGLEYRYDEVRPNVVVVDSDSLEVVARGFIAVEPIFLNEWQGRLLRCATVPGEPHTRLDPTTARLVAVSDEEAIACLNGDASNGQSTGYAKAQGLPILTTQNYRVFGEWKGPLASYRFAAIRNGSAEIRTTERQYTGIVAQLQRDAVVLSYSLGQKRCFSRFDIATQTETTLFCMPAAQGGLISTAWRNYLFVAMNRDLLVFDLERRLVASYEKDLISEGLEPICASCNDRNGIRELRLDKDRLIVFTLDGANSRVIDLPVYVASFTGTDFFEGEAQPERRQ